MRFLTRLQRVNKLSTLILVFSVFIIAFIGYSFHSTSNSESEIDLDHKIGQMIMVGFRGVDTTGSNIHQLISQYKIGGVVLYNRDLPSKDSLLRNVASKEQLKQLNAQLQSADETKLIIAIDEEGGLVSRLKPDQGFEAHKSHQEIGEMNNADSTKIWAKQMAEELSDLGINMNFAPVVDININPESPAIGKIKRSFSKSTEVVISNSKIFMDEHKKKNIICVPKHFPGHGSAAKDSHKGITDVTATWSEEELNPYKALIDENYCDIIMTAHVYNAQLDTLPSTLSPKIINETLRSFLKFDGVIISDDMHMRAISNFFTFEQSIERAISAGVDILLFSNNAFPCKKDDANKDCKEIPYDDEVAIKAIKHIKQLVERGQISEDRINQSFDRIERMKRGM